MKKAPIPKNETERKKALDQLHVLDTPAEDSFDQITKLASDICQTRVALVSLVDSDRQWFKSKSGLSKEVNQTPRDISFCGHAIMGNDIFEIQDASLDPRFSDNPLYLNEPNVRFYAGAPLITSEGLNVGTLCVIDHMPKTLSDMQKRTLKALAAQVMAMLELRRHRDQARLLFRQLEEAQSIAKIGSWEFDLTTLKLSWSLEHYRIFEIEYPQPQEKLFQLYKERIHPDDLARLEYFQERAIKNGEDFIYDHRVFLEGGKRIKYVQGIGNVVKNSEGKSVLLRGTCRDKTADLENENHYRTVISTMSEGLVIQNHEGRITNFNPAALELLGLSADQLLGRTCMDPQWKSVKEDGSHFPGGEHPAVVALRTNVPVRGAVMGVHLSNHDIRWIKINAVPYETSKGREVTVTFSDMTEFVRASRDNRFVLDTLGLGVWKFNPQTKDLYWDRSMYKLFDIDERAFSGSYEAWENALTPESKSQAVEELNRALRGESEFRHTFEIVTRSGVKKYIGSKSQVIRNDRGEPTLMLGVNWDRTKEAMLEKSLAQERAKALHSAKLASLGEMSAGVAHEISNPLAVIHGNISLLKNFVSDEARLDKKIEVMLKAVDRISKIVKGLRKFSRTSDGVQHKPEQIQSILNEVMVLAETKAKRHSIPVELNMESNAVILCDGVEIEQALVNLINNAIDAAKDTAEKWVRVNVFEKGNDLVIQVIDSGKGIGDQVREKLFQPFYTTKPIGEGTGLGLSIAKGILNDHQATLVLNQEFKNTCFEIRLKISTTFEKAA